MKVGDLAARCGLSVRTLHYYDEIGLLSPSGRTAAGHRLYVRGDLDRLQRIVSLRQLGLSLEQIGDCLDRDGCSIREVIERQRAWLDSQIEAHQRLRDRLDAIAGRLDSQGEVSTADLLQTIEDTVMFEKYYTKQQLDTLEQRRRDLGEAAIAAAEHEWADLLAAARAAMAAGTDPRDPSVQALARRSRELVEQFTGGDASIRESLRELYANEPAAAERAGVDRAVMAYLARATP